MKAEMRRIRKTRVYTESFKCQLVHDFESGRYSVAELSRLHGVCQMSIYRWVYKFSTFNQYGYRVVEHNQSSMDKVKQLEKRIKELERMVGQKQIKIDYLEKMIDIAKDELDIDIKKNSDTPPFGGSGKTDRA